MKLKLVKKGEFLIVRGTKAQGLTARGRIMESSLEQTIEFIHPDVCKNIRLTHISGPMKGSTIEFQKIRCRKTKKQNVCRCEAYKYPHAKGRGKCKKDT